MKRAGFIISNACARVSEQLLNDPQSESGSNIALAKTEDFTRACSSN